MLWLYKHNWLTQLNHNWLIQLNQEYLSSRHFLSQKLWHFHHKNTRSCVKIECCCPHTVCISNVNINLKISTSHFGSVSRMWSSKPSIPDKIVFSSSWSMFSYVCSWHLKLFTRHWHEGDLHILLHLHAMNSKYYFQVCWSLQPIYWELITIPDPTIYWFKTWYIVIILQASFFVQQ